MSHQEMLWFFQSCWEAIKALGPVVLLAGATYWLTTWGEKAR